MSRKASPELSIVIGALNEEKRIGPTLKKVHEFLVGNEMLDSTEVVIVTADARDKTHEIVAKDLKRFPLHQHLRPGRAVGKGMDISYGMQRARGGLCIFMDADLAAPIHHILEIREQLLEQPDAVVIGVRDLRKIHEGIFRTAMSMGGNLLFKLGTGLYVSDTQCGLKGMSGELARKLFSKLQIQGWGFDMELIAIAHAQRHPIIQIPIHDWKDVAGGTVHGNTLSAARTSLNDLLHIIWRNIKGQYKER